MVRKRAATSRGLASQNGSSAKSRRNSSPAKDHTTRQPDSPNKCVPSTKVTKVTKQLLLPAAETNYKLGSDLRASFEWCNTFSGSQTDLASPSSSKWNMKLVSWNVNGLKAWLQKSCQNYILEERPDIIGLQEIKSSLSKIPTTANVASYFAKWSSAVKEGYAGTGLLSQMKPLGVTFGIGKKIHDEEGRVITAEYDKFYFVTTYVPNSGRGLVRLDYRISQWNLDFCNFIKELDKKKPVIITGDLNVAHEEIDLANPKGNRKTAGFTDEERAGFTTLLKDANLVDTYRHFYPNREKAFTFWNYMRNSRSSNTGWRLDYFLVSRRFLPNVVDHEIRCGVLGSDHCPIVLYINV